MPKLYFRYGTMNSSKTANLLMVAHNYLAQGKEVLLVKPEIDTRFGTESISSRAVDGMKAHIILSETTEIQLEQCEGIHCILVDEAQFLSEYNINNLRMLTEKVPVICYGLRTDYRTRLFSGSKRLMEIADTIEEIKTVCVECDRKAIINAKFRWRNSSDKEILHDGSSKLELGAEEKYQPMCWKCWISF